MTIFGTDQRVKVSYTTTYPYSAVVQVAADFDGDGSWDSWGSGAMISSDDVLTAAHVLWSPYYGYAKNVWVTPALSGSSAPFGVVSASAWHVPDDFTAVPNTAFHDYGVVNLSSPVGTSTGTFDLQPTTATALIGQTLTTAGYPGDISSDGSTMVTTSGPVTGSIGSSFATYTIDAYPGQSGSPGWIMVDGHPTIVNIVTYQTWFYNAGTVITQDYYDQIVAWSGGDIEEGTDSTATSGTDSLTGGAGDDIMSGLGGGDTIRGNDGNDILYGNLGLDTIRGGNGSDTLYGGQNDGPAGSDGVFRQGIERIEGDAGDDVIYGNMGDDGLDGGAGADTIYGGQDYDSLTGGDGDDLLFGNRGRDRLTGSDGADTLYGNNDVDTLSGGPGNDVLDGGENVDTLRGGAGNDSLFGGDGRDLLSGGDGDDLMYGDNPYYTDGASIDTLYGGGGSDTAVYIYDLDTYFFDSLSGGGVQINGYDELYEFEYVRFADTIVATDSLI